MKYFFIAIFLIVMSVSCSQYSEEVAHCLVLAEKIMDTQPDSALHLLEYIKNQRHLSKEQYANNCLLYTEALDKTRQKLISDTLINIAINYFSAYPNQYDEKLAKAMFYLGRIYHTTGRLEDAMKIYIDVEAKVEKLSNPNFSGLVNSEMGHLLQRQNLSEKAISHYRNAVDYFHQAKNHKNKGYALMSVGLNHYVVKRYDSASFYLQEVRQIAQEIKDTALLSQSLMALSIVYVKLKKPEVVKLYLQECLDFEINERRLALSYNALSEAYLTNGHWESSRFYANKALEKGISIGSVYSQATSYQYLYLIEKDEGNYKQALAYYDKCIHLKDSIGSVENKNNVLEIQEKYNAERWKNKILQLESAREYMCIFLIALSAIISVLVLMFFLRSSRQRQKLLESEALALKNEVRLKEFLLKRLDVSKEVMTLAQHPHTDSCKIQSKLHNLVNKLTFNAADREALIDTVNELFDGFADKLSARYPTLTPEDIQLCCMIRSGFDAGNMATIMGINFESVYKKRSRMRKKMGLKKKENVDDFLARI